MSRFNVYLLLALFVSFGCSSIKNLKRVERPNENNHIFVTQNSEMADSVTKQMSVASPKNSSKKNGMALTFERHHYEFWLKYFGKKEPERFIRHLQNGERYKSLVTSIFKEHGLPEDLFYVGLIESGYNSRARSTVRATGPWQFMRATGKQYGLRVDNQVDERMNIYKSTHAAAKYLKNLYSIFGSWELALCAYNAGEGRVLRALKKTGVKDYKGLVKTRALPLETVFYIPKIAAARELERNLEKYGLPLIEDHSDLFDRAKPVKLTKRFSLSELARKNKVSVEAMKMVNRDLKTDLVQISRRKGHIIYIPEVGSQMPTRVPTAERVTKVAKKKIQTVYVVKRGDNLKSISKRFKVRLKQLLSLNKLKGQRVNIGQRIIIPI